MNVCVLVMEGTNNEAETMHCLLRVGLRPSLVHVRELTLGSRHLKEFQGLVIPGGFSAGDYVRSGAIFASYLRSMIMELRRYIDRGHPVLGICNGFQILVELGFLPDFGNGKLSTQTVGLAMNSSARFECRTIRLRRENNNLFTHSLDPEKKDFELPVAHAEGRFVAPREVWQQVVDTDQVAFRYVGTDGDPVGYPQNPNGSLDNIAGLSNPAGNVLGMMPHPERAFYWYQASSWTRRKSKQGYGPGYTIFQGMADYIKER